MNHNIGARLRPLVPLLVVLALYGKVTETFVIPALLACVALLCGVTGPRLPVDRATQRVFAIVCAVLAVSIARASIDPEQAKFLHPFWVGIVVASSLIVSFRALCKIPDGGVGATIAFEIAALLAVGETRVGVAYPIAVVAFLGVAISALRGADPARLPLRRVSSRSRKIAVAIVVATLPLAAAIALPARPAANYLHRRIEAAFDRAYENRGGTFADGMRVGKLSRMLHSDTVALRIYGPKPDLLRGVVLDFYSNGLFSHAREMDPNALVETRRGPLEGSDVVYVMRSGRETDRFFLPLGATDLASAAGQIRSEPFRVFRGNPSDATKRYWYREPPRAGSIEDETTPADTDLPSAIRAPLVALAEQWTEGAVGDAAILDRIETHLRTEFTYGLDRDHSRGADPVLHFLYRDRVGHCEYFAAAMTLLARAKGIPARYVAGYRVSERNPIDGHYVVREKNAHSWVEARVGTDGWRTFDPTPATEQLGVGSGAGSVDFLASLWERATAWLVDRSLTELTIAAACGTLLFALVRWWRGRNAEHDDEAAEVLVAAPLPYFADLLSALGDAGFLRAPSMPIERYARTLPDETARGLILRYAALRYGGALDADLPRATSVHAASVRAAARAQAGRRPGNPTEAQKNE